MNRPLSILTEINAHFRRARRGLLALLLATPYFSPSAFAFAVTCKSPQELDPHIRFCSDNQIAVKSAQSCYEELTAAIDAAAPELAAYFQAKELNANSQQSSKFKFSSADYAKTQAKLNQLIAQTTFNIDLIASYPKTMLDDSNTSNISVPCYSDNVAALTKIVNNLDKKVTELRVSKRATKKLKKTASTRLENVGSGLGGTVLVGSQVGKGKAPQIQNTVTGEIGKSSLTGGALGKLDSQAIPLVRSSGTSENFFSSISGSSPPESKRAAFVRQAVESEKALQQSLQGFSTQLNANSRPSSSEELEVQALLKSQFDEVTNSARSPSSVGSAFTGELPVSNQNEITNSESDSNPAGSQGNDVSLGDPSTTLFDRIHDALRKRETLK